MNFKVVPKQKNVMKYFWVTFRRPISPIVQWGRGVGSGLLRQKMMSQLSCNSYWLSLSHFIEQGKILDNWLRKFKNLLHNWKLGTAKTNVNRSNVSIRSKEKKIARFHWCKKNSNSTSWPLWAFVSTLK